MAETTAVLTGRPKGAKTRWPGIGEAARRLRVSDDHLRLVLEYKRTGSVRLWKGLARLNRFKNTATSNAKLK